MDDKSKNIGAKQAAETMLYYYLSSLIDAGVQDPKQVIATELGKMINLSEEQVQYVRVYLQHKNDMIEGLTCSIDLLNQMQKTGKIDLDSVTIVKSTLETLLKECNKAIKEHCVIDSE